MSPRRRHQRALQVLVMAENSLFSEPAAFPGRHAEQGLRRNCPVVVADLQRRTIRQFPPEPRAPTIKFVRGEDVRLPVAGGESHEKQEQRNRFETARHPMSITGAGKLHNRTPSHPRQSRNRQLYSGRMSASPTIALSILDQSPIRTGGTGVETLHETLETRTTCRRARIHPLLAGRTPCHGLIGGSCAGNPGHPYRR